ncbi:amino acid adenylation domain-containing protein [Microbulbifer thermotolerans]|uniref:non-ribosomal peptide synthetase n=1 Tax=Microbulbifer thermotolerans TaxID=252514 RepID=UPI00224A6B71|nr:non-ribosomal peptide synthetase [Microbulbifer thermotolerans]MCX2842978.1 amino acid adenylation domain-containing protein [Microbulbifer thermotolerans]
MSEVENWIPLTHAQEGIWYADKVSESKSRYVIAHCVELTGEVDMEVLRSAIRMGLSEVDTVSAHYCSEQPRQSLRNLSADCVPEVEYTDYLHDPQGWEKAWNTIWHATESPAASVDPVSGYQAWICQKLFRVKNGRGESRILWYQRFHHIMLDGFSFVSLTRRIAAIYTAWVRNEDLPPANLTSVEAVVAEQRAYRASEKWEKSRIFWQKTLNACPRPAPLAPPLQQDSEQNVLRHHFCLAAETLKRMQIVAESNNQVSAPDLVLGMLAAYLSRVSGRSHQLIGVPFMGRMGSVAISSAAPVVNVLPVPVQLGGEMPLAACARAFKQALARVRPYQRYPAEQIQRDRGQLAAENPLYGPVINYKPFDFALDFAGTPGITHQLATGPVDDIEIGLLFAADDTGEQTVQFDLRANGSRYSERDLIRHAERISALLERWLAAPETPLGQVDVRAPREIAEIARWSKGRQIYRDASRNTIADWLHFQAEINPRRRALIWGDDAAQKSLDFQGLSASVAQLSRLLIDEGVGPGTVVALALPRTVDAVVSIFAVLNSGAALLPIDLDYPAERIAQMCEDASPSILLSRSEVKLLWPASVRRLDLDKLDERLRSFSSAPLQVGERLGEIGNDAIAYVIFTSGSTGRPKGVMNTHGALLNLFQSHREQLFLPVLEKVQKQHPGRSLRAAHTHSFSFDSSWVQFFWLLLGQELHIFDEEARRDAWGLVQSIQRRQIDALDLPPSLLAQMIGNGLFAAGRHHPAYIAIGGEAAPEALWRILRAQPGLFAQNLYGPTEYTVDALGASLSACEIPVVGRPIGNTRVYVLDAFLQPVPQGTAGELYLSGAGLALGYLGRGALTASRFVADPFTADGGRMYRTGDLVRWNSAGQLEFLGRSDHQVKVRGHRVELGEIENALSMLPAVEAAAVITRQVNGSARLIGCVAIPGLGEAEKRERPVDLLTQLRHRLPDYMVPAQLLVLDSLPQNMSGKIDRRALAELAQQALQEAPAQGTERPRNAREELLCQAMGEVLQLSAAVGAADDFFALGGDSISAIMLCTRMRESGYGLKPSQVFAHRSPRQLAPLLTETHAAPVASGTWSLPPAQREALRERHGEFAATAPVLPLQQGMLFHIQAHTRAVASAGDAGDSYNAFTRLRICGALDEDRLRRALNRVLERYPQLGGLFDSDGGDGTAPVFLLPQKGSVHWPWRSLDLSDLPEKKRADKVVQLEREMLQRNYPTDRFGGMLGAALVRVGVREYRLLLVTHHLVIDGWSTPLLLRDLLTAYRQDPQPLPAQRVDYPQVVRALVGRDLSASRDLWRQVLTDVRPCVLFGGGQSEQAPVSEAELRLPAALTARLNSEIRRRGYTLNAVMQGVWAQVLSGISGRRDLVFGTPVSGRTAAIPGIEEQVGLFLNTLPIPVSLCPEQSLWQQLPEIQARHSQLLENDGLGLAEIQQLAGGEPLFDTLLVVENYPDSAYLEQQLTGTDGEPLVFGDIHNRGYSHYPLALLVIPGEALTLLVENRGAVADPRWIAERVAEALRDLLEMPERPLCRAPLLSKPEAQLIASVNDTAHSLGQQQAATLQSLLAAQAARAPAVPALLDSRDTLDYRQLRAQVQALAQEIIEAGVVPGAIVAVALPRSVRLSLALMAVIEAGAAYLPLDLGYPDERLGLMLADAAPQLLITDSDHRARFAALADTKLLACDRLADSAALPSPSAAPLRPVTPEHPAYVIYTSGTTGRPKGVLVSHRAIVNRILWMQHEYALCASDVVLQKTPCSFDVSVWEFFWPLIVGARLVMAEPEAHRDPQQLVEAIEQFGVTCLHFVPSMLALFTEHANTQYPQERNLCPSLRLVFCSGEALSQVQVNDFSTRFNACLHNLYGPTEAAVDVSYFPASSGDLRCAGDGVPIGRPVWNTQLRILDDRLRQVPVGATGELYISGVQLAMGYLGRAALTASRFVADPYASEPGARMYRTGDLVRWLPDGNIEYLGRADDQIKIRGQRVELGEIESQLRQLPGVANAAVCAMTLGVENPASQMDSRQLVAYLIAAEGADLDTRSIAESLAAHLPAHMLPVAYVTMEAFPLSANGKLDRRALPKPDCVRAEGGRANERRLPARGLESRLAAVFARLLQREQVFADDDFFALGGHSLLAMRLAAEIRREIKRPVSVGQIITAPTVAQLAAVLNRAGMLNDFGSEGFDEVLPLRGGEGAPLICFYPGSGFAWQYSVLSRYLSGGRPIIGLQSPRPNGLIATSADMETLIERQLAVLRRIQPAGPYYLLGYSLGGSVAYGVAAALRKAGEEVAFLGLLDTYPSEVHDWDDPDGAEAALGAEQEQTRLLNEAFTAGGETREDELMRREREAMLAQIFANYQDAVRLLSSAQTPVYEGRVTLFVAERSLPDYVDPVGDWSPLVGELDVHRLPERAHDDILAPESLETLGPLIDRLLLAADGVEADGAELSETA